MNGSVLLSTAWTSSLISQWWSSAGSCLNAFLQTRRAETKSQLVAAHNMEANGWMGTSRCYLSSLSWCDWLQELCFLSSDHVLINVCLSISGSTAASPGRSSDDEPHLSQSASAQCKLLAYRTLVKHYSHADRAPLLPPHMADVCTAITELLGENHEPWHCGGFLSIQDAYCMFCVFALPVNAKLDRALEALQLCLKLLPPSCRDELCRLLTFMCLAADPQGIKLDKEVRCCD